MNARRPRRPGRLAVAGVALATLLGACANGVTVPPLLKTLIFKIQVKGQIAQNPDIRYVLAIDTNGNTKDGPKPYGPWPPEKPALGWDLPFYITDKTQGVINVFNPLPEPTMWTDVFMLVFTGGQPQFHHWRQMLDDGKPSVPPKIQPQPDLVRGQDWNVSSSAAAAGGAGAGKLDSIDLTLLLGDRFVPNSAERLKELRAIEANLVIQTRPPEAASRGDPTGWKIDQWFTNPVNFFSINLDEKAPVKTEPALDLDPQFRQNIPPGLNPDDVTFNGYSSEVKKQGL